MKIFRHDTNLTDDVKGGVLAIGNFDGVHLGHQAVIQKAKEIALEKGVNCNVVTFEPHPRRFFVPNAEPFALTPYRSKVHLLEKMGIDHLFILHFNQTFSERSAEEFVESVLVNDLQVKDVVVGHDYVFGHNRKGDVHLLKELGLLKKFDVHEVAEVLLEDGSSCSSSRIREYLQNGKPQKAAKILGHPWQIEGRIEHGDARGHDVGFPTANLHLGECLHPKEGVYAIRCQMTEDRGHKMGIANFGKRPTFDGKDIVFEVHIFDFDQEIYGEYLMVELIDFIRPEQKLHSVEELHQQIEKDVVKVKAILSLPLS